jgi:hypothetical protein
MAAEAEAAREARAKVGAGPGTGPGDRGGRGAEGGAGPQGGLRRHRHLPGRAPAEIPPGAHSSPPALTLCTDTQLHLVREEPHHRLPLPTGDRRPAVRAVSMNRS